MNTYDFLPVSREEMQERGWYYYDFLIVTGDAYVDHPSFGAAVISRILEAEGYRVAVLAQPYFRDASAFEVMGQPRYAALITAGNLDSMVARFTAAKKPRSEDFYSPGKKSGLRPERASIVYSNRIREVFPGLPIVLGGLEASLRRFAHYDYWDDKIRRPILFDSGANFVVYGMGETAIISLAKRLAVKGGTTANANAISNIRGIGYITADVSVCPFPHVVCESFEEVSADKKAYANAAMTQYNEHDPICGKAVIQKCGSKTMIVNPPSETLSTSELDRIAALPYTRKAHPMYEKAGGVPAIDEVRFSVIHNRGCFGACNFCSLAFHQGRIVASRSHDSVIREIESFVGDPEFKGYVHDIGGPTANFRHPSCKKQLKEGMCRRNCLVPEPCGALDASHTDYLLLLRKAATVPGVKKIFVRSGIRYDYMMLDKNGEFFAELVKNHISGQLKVAPEHCGDTVLYYMGKPRFSVFERFSEKFKRLNTRYGKEQYLVPYLISSHPGSTIHDAIALAELMNRSGIMPQQVQDFYPTPGTLSTCMYYTGLDPRTMKPLYVPRSRDEKAEQRALLQWKRRENRKLVRDALIKAGRVDLIGYGKRHLAPPERGR